MYLALNDIVLHNSLELNWSLTPLCVATSAAAARWRWRVGAPVASSARFSWLRYQDFLVRRRLLLLLLRRRRDAHIPNAAAAVSVLRVAIVRVCVMWVHLRAPATGERLPSSLPRPSVRRSSCERASKQASILYLLARSLARFSVSRKPRKGKGRGRSSDSNSRLSSNLGRVTLAEAALLTSTAAATATTAKAVSVSAASVRRSVGRSGSGGEKRNLPPSASRPSARASVARQSEAVGPKSWGSRHHPPPSL